MQDNIILDELVDREHVRAIQSPFGAGQFLQRAVVFNLVGQFLDFQQMAIDDLLDLLEENTVGVVDLPADHTGRAVINGKTDHDWDQQNRKIGNKPGNRDTAPIEMQPFHDILPLLPD